MNHQADALIADAIPISSREDRVEDRISGALLGGAIADAMGWVTEFVKSQKQLSETYRVSRVEDFVGWEKKTGGRFNTYIEYVGRGEYSDDTQLTLCVARSLRPDGTCDNEYFAKVEMPTWLSYARGAGATITAAAKALQRKTATWNNNFFVFRRGAGSFDYRTAGSNGAAMRIGPVAMANFRDIQHIEREVWKNSIVTHGHPRAIVGALVYARALAYLLSTATPQMDTFIDSLLQFVHELQFPDDSGLREWKTEWERGTSRQFDDTLVATKDEMGRMLGRIAPANRVKLYQLYDEFGCFAPATRGSGVSTVAAALGTFLRHGRNFERAVLEAVNMLGSDTDTIAAMVGSMAGAYAGYVAIPERWATQMQDFSYFMRVAAALARISEGKAKGPELMNEPSDPMPKGIPEVMSLMQSTNLATRQRVRHALFGLGTIRSVDVQPLRRRQGGSMLFIFVEFDVGQSCKFRFFRPTGPKKAGEQPSLFR